MVVYNSKRFLYNDELKRFVARRFATVACSVWWKRLYNYGAQRSEAVVGVAYPDTMAAHAVHHARSFILAQGGPARRYSEGSPVPHPKVASRSCPHYEKKETVHGVRSSGMRQPNTHGL